MTAQEVDSPHFPATFSEKVQHVSLPMPDITQRTPQHHSAKAMYAVIECVPFRQWREFVRRLGLSDHLIDTTEQDYRVYKDSQYKMLQAWANLEGSSMDQLYRVLREMNLGGCVERIEERL
ncbi:tumor necrosis factor receptor superfamily member 1A-like [Gastrophryne carolinensis]